MTDEQKPKNDITPKPIGRPLSLGCFIQLAVLLVIVGGVVALLASGFNLGGFLNRIFMPGSITNFDTPTIIRSIEPLGELVSMRVQVAKADISVNLRYGVGGVCNITAKHVAEGTIEAGVDLRGVGPEDVVYDELTDTYTITLPPPRLTSCTIDPVSMQQYSVTGDIPVTCPADRDEMRRFASYLAIQSFRNDALEGGILNQARTQASLVLTSFIESLTNSTVRIVFAGGEAPLPASCSPNPPGGWVFDSQSGRWVKP